MPRLINASLLAIPALALLVLNSGRADGPPKPESSAAERMHQVVNDIEMLGIREDGTRYRIDQPQLLRTFFDPNRGRELNLVQTGTLWAWGEGRPVALTEIWRWGDTGNAWGQTLMSTTPGHVTASLNKEADWKPEQPGLEFSPFEGAPTPAEVTEERNQQMDGLIARFRGYELVRRRVVDLQLVPEPLLQYQEAGVNGAVFTLADNGNPEAILFLEAVSDPIKPSYWRFAWVKASSNPVTVELDENEILQIPGSRFDTGRASATFWVTFRSASGE